MRTLLLLVTLLTACDNGPEYYDYPAWGDPCVPDPDRSVFRPCHHGDFFGTGGPDPAFGFCAPVADSEWGGMCRPFFTDAEGCPDGTVVAIDSLWGVYYCTEAL